MKWKYSHEEREIRWFCICRGMKGMSAVINAPEFRRGPVAGIHNRGNGKGYRHMKTTQERRANTGAERDGRTEKGYKTRGRRSRRNLVNAWDDVYFSRRGNNWKKYRRHQWRDK